MAALSHLRAPVRLALLLAAVALAGAAAAQQQVVGGGPRATPRDALLGYLEACRDGNFARAAEFLDLSGVPSDERAERGPQLARKLKVVLDQKLWVDVDAVSDEPSGDLEDGMEERDVIGVIETATGRAEVALDRLDGENGPEWHIARSTVSRTEALYDEFGLGRLGEVLPPVLFSNVGDLQLWQLLGLVLLVLVALALAWAAARVTERIALRMVARTETGFDDRLLEAVTGPLTAALLVIFFWLGSFSLRLAVPVQNVIGSLAEVAVLLAVTWVAIRLIDVAAHAFEERLTERGETTALTIIPIGRRISKVFLVVIATLSGLQNFGYNVVGLIAGLGVVGLAVAFAAQKTIENFFGALSLLGDRPVRRGDFCRYGDKVGTVEDIGLRSTRIRSLDRTLVTIPNAEFSTIQLENFAARDRIRFFAMLGLRYETTADQMRHVLVKLKELLVGHPRVTPDPARIRLVGFGAYSLDLELFCYIDTSDWAEFLAIREDLMLRIMDVIEASGTGFAFPSQTLYLGRDDGLDAELARSAEDQVARWREARELCLPDLPEAKAQELERTLAYPEEGSINREPPA